MDMINNIISHCPLYEHSAVDRYQQYYLYSFRRKNWDCPELNLGPVDIKRKSYLCALLRPPPQLRTKFYQTNIDNEIK